MAFHFRSYESGVEFDLDLFLWWECDSDPITDDYTPEDVSARDLWAMWIERLKQQGANLAEIPILWGVEGEAKAEFAPFVAHPYHDNTWKREDFLTFYTWPVDDDGERIQFSRLPVEDKLWRPGQADKGGFIQEATGWKPSALQATVDVTVLGKAAGL